MSNHPLFRTEALKKRQVAPIGSVILAHPVSFSVLTAITAVAAAMMVLMVVFGQYTKKVPVSGQLVPNLGLAAVYARQPGVIMRKAIVEGQTVKRGDVLFELSGEMRSDVGDTHAAITQQMSARRASLREERDSTRLLQERERIQQEQRAVSLKSQLEQLEQQIATQKSQIDLATRDLERYQGLVQKNYVSRDSLLQKENAVLEQKSKLQATMRDHTSVQGDYTTVIEDLEAMKYRHQKQIGVLDRQLATEVQEYAENEATHRQVLVATQTGIIALVNGESGQRVDQARPLATIVPENSRLQAQLFVPSSAAGFIKVGTPVNLRYRTYPYQIFGLARGTVSSISKSALPAKDILTSVTLNSTDPAEPVFRVTVELPDQVLKGRGNSYPLQTGMLVDGDVLLETKRLYQWVIDPLYGAARTLLDQ